MASPLYYLPGRKTATAEALAALGLGYLLDAGEHCLAAAEVPHSGPDGKAGCVAALAAPDGEAPAVGGLNAAAKFQPLPGSAAWVGWDPAAPPGPADLARRQQLDGHLVTLGDGKQWLVPVARAIGGETRFPCNLAFDGKRWARGEVLEQYAGLFAAACRFWDLLLGAEGEGEGGERTVTLNDECGAVAAALGCNYRIGPNELSLWKLLPEPAAAAAVKALVDWPTFKAELKKKLPPGGPSSGPGAPG